MQRKPYREKSERVESSAQNFKEHKENKIGVILLQLLEYLMSWILFCGVGALAELTVRGASPIGEGIASPTDVIAVTSQKSCFFKWFFVHWFQRFDLGCYIQSIHRAIQFAHETGLTVTLSFNSRWCIWDFLKDVCRANVNAKITFNAPRLTH